MKNKVFSTTLGVMSALALILAAPAFADPDAADQAAPANAARTSDVGLSDVIVTARRVEERLQDVPISIAVFNQEQLANRNVTSAQDLAAITPSLSVNSNFGQENSSFAIRGFVQDAGTPPSVATYFADVVAPRGPTQGTQAGDSPIPGSFFDLQNVQVLKGPQGTLFGRNTTGGAVLFVPQKPTSQFGGYGEVSFGNYSMKREQGALNLPLSDTVRFRLAVDHETRDGYLHNISGIGPSDYNDVDYTAVRASLVVDLTPNLENYTIASYNRSDTNGSVQKLIACNPTGYNPVNPATGLGNFIGVLSCGQLAAERASGAGFYDVEAATPNPVSNIEQEQLINTTTWTASDQLTVKNIASYAQYKDLQVSPLFGTNWQTSNTPIPYPQIFFLGVPRVFTGVYAAPGDNTADQSTITEELQLQGAADDRRLTYQGGVYFEWSNPLNPVGNQSPQLAPCTDLATVMCSDPIGAAFTAATSAALGFPFPVHVGAVNYTVGETNYRDKGIYGQSSYSFTDQWKLTGGLRYTEDSQANSATRYSYSFPVFPPFTGAATKSCTDPTTAPTCYAAYQEKSSKPTWLIDLDYKPTEDVLTYAKYARGYRAGGVTSNAPIDHRTFSPESVDDFELGLKTAFRGAVRGTFDVDLFYNNFTNQELQFGFNAKVNPLTGASAPVSPTTAIINAGKSRIYGAEVDASLIPFPSITALEGLVFSIDYTYLNATIQKIAAVTTADPNYTPDVSAIAPGSPLVLSPKNKYSLTANYTLPLPASIGRIIFGANFVHTDEQTTTYVYQNAPILAAFGSNLGLLPSTNLLNLDLSWDSIAGSPVDLSFFATNVTQKNYYNFVPGLASSGAEFAVLGVPRMYGARLRYRFGK
jgi:iron complex outermembrane receptor protein